VGTDGYRYSGSHTIEDPFTGQPAVVLPALNPDAAIIHVQEADVYGNARVFGTGIAHTETALASKKVILSAERIVDTEEIRRNPDSPRSRGLRLTLWCWLPTGRTREAARASMRRPRAHDRGFRSHDAGPSGRVPGEMGLQRRRPRRDARTARWHGQAHRSTHRELIREGYRHDRRNQLQRARG